MRVIRWLAVIGLVAAAALFVAHLVSPWPSALLFRTLFDYGGVQLSEGLRKHVPPGVAERLNLRYDSADRDALFDVFYPAAIQNSGKSLPTIVWIHGGGFISGSKDQIANYARILASHGYTVVGVDYTIAPGASYPRPLHQINAALAYLVNNAKELHIDPSRIVLAGDSAGAQIAAQMTNVASVPAYAKAVGILPALERRQLIGTLLLCGVYDVKLFQPGSGGFFIGQFLQTVGRSYFGSADFAKLPSGAQFSVVDHITADYPPVFISAGNKDPLLPHSLAMADALTARGVRVDRLFFPADTIPALDHEYQFVLDNDAGKLALRRILEFLSGLP